MKQNKSFSFFIIDFIQKIFTSSKIASEQRIFSLKSKENKTFLFCMIIFILKFFTSSCKNYIFFFFLFSNFFKLKRSLANLEYLRENEINKFFQSIFFLFRKLIQDLYFSLTLETQNFPGKCTKNIKKIESFTFFF